MSWTTPADIEAQLQRRWDRGELLVPEPSLFPLALRLRRPETRELSERFEEVRGWIRQLKEGESSGYKILWTEVNNRQLGTNQIPSGLLVPTLEDALGLLGKRRAAARYDALVALTEARCPRLIPWIRRKPLLALHHADDWERLLSIVTWFEAHPRPGVYLRQIDLPGIHTKFIEGRRALIAELLDEVLPGEAVARELSPTRQFDGRYGLRAKPMLIRFRLLDERLALQGLSDVSTPAGQFASLHLPVRRVIITENETNGLAAPPLAEGLVIFGLGYGLLRLAMIEWLREKEVYYWGDLDTHGFAMLDRLRALLPGARSLLMDEETLLAHRSLWGEEESPHHAPLERLTEPERRLYEDLRSDRWAPRLRLEQERLGFSWVERAWARLEPAIMSSTRRP